MPSESIEPLFNPPAKTEREIVTVLVPPHPHDITIAVEDGLRVAVTYGNTTRILDATTGQWLGTTTDGTGAPSVAPRIKVVRIGPDELAHINETAHRVVYGDA